MKMLPIISITGLALFGAAWLIPINPAGRLSLLAAGGMMNLLAYTLSLERAFRQEVRLLNQRISDLEEEVNDLKGQGA